MILSAVGQQRVELAEGLVGHEPIGVLVIGERNDGGAERPAFASLPGGVVDVEFLPENLPCWFVEHLPGDGDIASRITNAHHAPIDRSAESSIVVEEQIP